MRAYARHLALPPCAEPAAPYPADVAWLSEMRARAPVSTAALSRASCAVSWRCGLAVSGSEHAPTAWYKACYCSASWPRSPTRSPPEAPRVKKKACGKEAPGVKLKACGKEAPRVEQSACGRAMTLGCKSCCAAASRVSATVTFFLNHAVIPCQRLRPPSSIALSWTLACACLLGL